MSDSRFIRVAGFMAALLAIWWFVLPPQLGGRTTLFITKGISMEPYINDGDLAVLHEKSSYEVGDVIAFHSKTVNAVSLHRIIDIDPSGLIITQGDNNEGPDVDRTPKSEVIGRLDHLVKGGARYVEMLTSWPVRLAGAALIGMAVYGALRDLADNRNPVPTGAQKRLAALSGRRIKAKTPTASDDDWKGLALTHMPYLFGSIAALSAVVLFISASAPLTSDTERQVIYNLRGKFAYSAQAAPGTNVVYRDGQVSTGDPIFHSLVEDVFVTYEVDIEGPARFSGTGTIALDAVVSGRTGWHHTIPLVEEVTFNGSRYRTNTVINLADIREINEQVRELTKTSDPTYTVAIQPRVRFDGRLAGQDFSDDFLTSLSFVVDDRFIKMEEVKTIVQSPPGSPGYDPNNQTAVLTGLNPTKGGSLSVPAGSPMPMALFGLSLSPATAGIASFITLAFSLVAMVLSVMAGRRLRPEAEDVSAAAMSQYRSMMGLEEDSKETAAPNAIAVPTLTDLIAVAALYGESVQQRRASDGTVYFVVDGDVTYEHRISAQRTSTPEERFGIHQKEGAEAQS